jgi:hypothetical protein
MLSAVGFGFGKLTAVWLLEMLWICGIGGLLGIGLGIGYAQLMLWGLRTWWVGAIRTPFIELHISWTSIAIGAVAGIAIGLLMIVWTLWRLRRFSTMRLLAGQIDSPQAWAKRRTRWSIWLGWSLAAMALVLLVAALGQGGETQAGLFFGSGFCMLAAELIAVRSWLRLPGPKRFPQMNLATLAVLNARRSPLRSALTIGLVAVASFLIAAISA